MRRTEHTTALRGVCVCVCRKNQDRIPVYSRTPIVRSHNNAANNIEIVVFRTD